MSWFYGLDMRKDNKKFRVLLMELGTCKGTKHDSGQTMII